MDAMPETTRCEVANVLEFCKLSLQKGGVAIAVTVPDVINCPAARGRCIEQLIDLVARDIPVAVRPTGYTVAESALLLEFCRYVAAGFAGAGLEAAAIEFTVDAREVPPDAALYLARQRLGAGVLNVLVDAPAFARWLPWLWRTRRDPRRRMSLWPAVHSACPLLADEPATDVLPGAALQVPAQSAWWLAELPLDRYVTPERTVDRDALEAELRRVLDAAEQRHDTSNWPTPAMQQDAWLNRRVAIRFSGIGDLVDALGLDPRAHDTLRRLQELLAALRTAVVQHSRQLARGTETLPAIAAASPGHTAGNSPARLEWQQRWLRAVQGSATRHRNLIAMSPYAVFPAREADLRYADLLPIMRYADVCAIDGHPPLTRWNISNFNAFHARVRAIHAALCTGYVVAEQH